MKLSKKLCWIILGMLVCIGCVLYSAENFLFKTQDKTPKIVQNNSVTLQEAKSLFKKAFQEHDDHIMRQAIDKYSIWIKQNENNSNKKLVAGALMSRASAFMILNEPRAAVNDYKKSLQYNLVGEVQLGICLIEKQHGNLSVLHGCYVKAVDIFTKKKTVKTDGNFLIARILSGDKAAIIEYRDIFRTLTGDEREFYEMAAKEAFDKSTYEEIIK